MLIKKTSKFAILLLMIIPCILSNTPIKTYGNENVLAYGDLSIELRTKNTLELTTDTQNIIIDGYNGTSDFHNDFNIIVSSNLNYDVNVKMNDEFRNTSLEGRTLKSSLISMKNMESNSEVVFDNINQYFTLIENSELGLNNIHSIRLNLKGENKAVKGMYKTSFTIQATQK